MEKSYLLSLDQGTTSSRAIVFNRAMEPVSTGQYEFTQIFPRPGYVEHDPEEIFSTQMKAVHTALQNGGIDVGQIAAVGITNQRETVIAWQRSTGRPIYNAIVWQCRRGAPLCEKLKEWGWSKYVSEHTGLVIDSYFCATKIKWILDNVPEAKTLAAKNDLCFGTVDCWLLWKLTGGRTFATDTSNAARTMLFDIHTLDWDDELLTLFGIERSMLPTVQPSCSDFGVTDALLFGAQIPVTGVAGDQHAAMIGQCCFDTGVAKITFGTGCFILINGGDKPIKSESGLVSTVGWTIGKDTVYAIEGSAFNAGSAIKWLRDELHLIESPQQADRWALEVEDCAGVSFVPAFTGLGAPYWDMYARGILIGLTRGATNKHIARAVLESIALQSTALVKAMGEDIGAPIPELRVDGGVSNSEFVMQLQADLLQIPVLRPKCTETTAMGAAMLAGLGTGIYDNTDALRSLWQLDRRFEPKMSAEKAQEAVSQWNRAVERCRDWERK